MQVWPNKYNYQVCPHCNSKKLERVAVVYMGENYYRELSSVSSSGFICLNCDRYHLECDYKYMTDRAEMKRDIKRLQEYLQGDRK